jgi:sulfur relay (sulfurtransferase) complex TusBCD TusD component (DsrE family)
VAEVLWIAILCVCQDPDKKTCTENTTRLSHNIRTQFDHKVRIFLLMRAAVHTDYSQSSDDMSTPADALKIAQLEKRVKKYKKEAREARKRENEIRKVSNEWKGKALSAMAQVSKLSKEVTRLDTALKVMSKFRGKDKHKEAERMVLEAEEDRARLQEMQLEEEKKADNIDKGFREQIQAKRSVHEMEDMLEDMGIE